MEISYRRTPTSLLEGAFARLVKRRPIRSEAVVRVDLFHAVDLEFRRA